MNSIKLAPYVQLLSDVVNLTYTLGHHHGDKRLYAETKNILETRVIPGLFRLTTEFDKELDELFDEDYDSSRFISDYKTLVEQMKFKKAENFSRDYLRKIRNELSYVSNSGELEFFESFDDLEEDW